jgi:tRNA pseudouridine55 synthase
MNPEFKIVWDFHDQGEILLVDKPRDWSSFDVVKKVRSLFHVRKVGHAGTLDPNATGLLIVCTGKQTKKMSLFLDMEKEYEGSFLLGVRTPSCDSETEVSERKDASFVTRELLVATVKSFLGRQDQIPPMFSATKYGGAPLYLIARQGKTVERASKEIDIKEFEILEYEQQLVTFRIVCSKGTYIRTVVDDLGIKLGCGATLQDLRRIRIGPHSFRNAFSIEELIDLRDILDRRQHRAYEVSAST